MKSKKWNCNTCWVETILWALIKNSWKCNNCLTDTTEVEKPVWVKIIPESKPINIKSYKIRYLNQIMHKNYASIKEEKICIKYWDWYILHEDIIAWFKDTLEWQPTEYESDME
jgi:hypothetical protein